MLYKIVKVLSTSGSNQKWTYRIQTKVRCLGWKSVLHTEGPLSRNLEFDSYEKAEEKILSFCRDGEVTVDGNIYEFKKYTYYV